MFHYWWLNGILIGVIFAEIAALDTTVYLHRCSTHKAVSFHPVVEFIWQLILWLLTGIKRVRWVAVHLYHHVFPDVEGDPHSPILLGLWKVQLGNIFYYLKAAFDPKVLAYGKNIKPSWAEKHLFKSQSLGLAISITAGCFIFGFWEGMVIATTHAFLYLFFLNNLINGWCHARGYKNFPNTVAFNNRFIALITMGEGLHNNHHQRPGRAKLSVKKSELDPGWLVIRALAFLNLAHINHKSE